MPYAPGGATGNMNERLHLYESYECLHLGHLSPSSIQHKFEEQSLCITVIVRSECKNYMDIFETI
jgi:hypothetical protein